MKRTESIIVNDEYEYNIVSITTSQASGKGHLFEENVDLYRNLAQGTTAKAQGTTAKAQGTKAMGDLWVILFNNNI